MSTLKKANVSAKADVRRIGYDILERFFNAKKITTAGPRRARMFQRPVAKRIN